MPDKRMSKSQFVEAVAERSGLTKKQANAVLESLDQVVAQELGSTGEVMIPGLVKLNVVVKEAVPERQGINPFTKQPTTFKARPERKVIKARVVKGLKDSISSTTPTTSATAQM